MLTDRSRFIKGRVSCDFFEQLRPPNEQIAGDLAGVEGFDQQLEKFRICDQQLEQQTAQPMSLNEPDELIKGCIRIGGFSQRAKQKRPKLPENLPTARRYVRAC